EDAVALDQHEVRPAFAVALYRRAPFAAGVHGGSERGDLPTGHAGEGDHLALELRLRHPGPAGRLRGSVALQHPHASSSSSRAMRSHSSQPGMTRKMYGVSGRRVTWRCSQSAITIGSLVFACVIPPTPFR